MSGGYFNYAQHRIRDIVYSIDELVLKNNQMDSFGDEVGRNYPDDIIDKFKKASEILNLAATMAQRIDWLVSGDDSEDSFRQRWKDEIQELKNND